MRTKQYLIGQLAQLADVKPDSVRFYERSGLLPKPQRASSGYRIYGEAALRQLRFIKKAQALGFSLEAIHRILNLRGRGEETCQCVIAIAEATLSETEQRLNELHAFHDALKKSLSRWRRMSARRIPIAADFCALIESSGVVAQPTRRLKSLVNEQTHNSQRRNQP